MLCAWMELSYEDAAVALDLPIGTVRSRLSRARARLRELDPGFGHEQGESTTIAGGTPAMTRLRFRSHRFRDLPAGHLEARKQHLLSEIAREPTGLRLSLPTTPVFGRPRSWRPLVVVAVAVIALAGTGVAIAAGLGAFEGTPAPPDVSTNFTKLNQFADAAIQQGFSTKLPQTDASKAHGVVEIQTPGRPPRPLGRTKRSRRPVLPHRLGERPGSATTASGMASMVAATARPHFRPRIVRRSVSATSGSTRHPDLMTVYGNRVRPCDNRADHSSTTAQR